MGNMCRVSVMMGWGYENGYENLVTEHWYCYGSDNVVLTALDSQIVQVCQTTNFCGKAADQTAPKDEVGTKPRERLFVKGYTHKQNQVVYSKLPVGCQIESFEGCHYTNRGWHSPSECILIQQKHLCEELNTMQRVSEFFSFPS
jgi:hypothetical protein